MAIKNGEKKAKPGRRSVRGPRRASWKRPLQPPAEPPPAAVESVPSAARLKTTEHPEENEEDELADV